MQSNSDIQWSGKTSSFHHKWHDTPNSPDEPSGLRKVWFLDAQWSTCPVEVEDQVRDIWSYAELGNDQYIFKTSVEDLLELDGYVTRLRLEGGGWGDRPIRTNAIIQYIREHGIADDEQVIIHWWW